MSKGLLQIDLDRSRENPRMPFVTMLLQGILPGQN